MYRMLFVLWWLIWIGFCVSWYLWRWCRWSLKLSLWSVIRICRIWWYVWSWCLICWIRMVCCCWWLIVCRSSVIWCSLILIFSVSSVSFVKIWISVVMKNWWLCWIRWIRLLSRLLSSRIMIWLCRKLCMLVCVLILLIRCLRCLCLVWWIEWSRWWMVLMFEEFVKWFGGEIVGDV